MKKGKKETNANISFEDEFQDSFSNDFSQDDKLHKKLNRKRNAFVYICLLFSILICLLFTPIFNITNISVSGNKIVKNESILNKAAIYKGQNIFIADTSKAAQRIQTIPYIKSADVVRAFPTGIKINVKESNLSAYVEFSGKYIATDENGKVLEIVQLSENPSVPVISGARVISFKPGQIIDFSDKKKLNILLEYNNILKNIKLTNKIVKINITQNDNIKLTLDNEIVVIMGNQEKLAYKFSYLKKVLESQLKTYRGGTLDISDPDTNVRYVADVKY